MKVSVKSLGALFALLFTLILVQFINISEQYVVYLALACVVIFVTMVWQIRRKIPDIPFFFFNLTYFLFVISGGVATIISRKSVIDYLGGVSKESATQASLLALVGIIIVDFMYFWISSNERAKNNVPMLIKSTSPSKYQRQIVVLAFIVSTCCKLMMVAETAAYSHVNGYVALYTNTVSRLPSLIRYAGALFYFSLMLMLVCEFNKKVTYFVFACVGVIELIVLSAGDRGEAVCGILIVIIYTMQRIKKEPQFFRFKKLGVLALLVGIPVGMYVLQMIKYTRVGNVADLSFWEAVAEFFESQGVSLNVMGQGIELKEQMAAVAGSHFTFGHLFAYLQQNVISRTLFGFKAIKGNTVAAAVAGTSYGATMSYIRFPASYLAGIGCGTCYLSELFHDFSWLGVVVGNIGVVFLLRKLKHILGSSWIFSAIMLNIMRMVLLMPRGGYFKWLTEAFSFPNLLLLLVITLPGILGKQSSQARPQEIQ